MPEFEKMASDCLRLRNRIIDAIHHAGSGHAGGSLSAVELLWTLYSEFMRVRPEEPNWPGRDRFVLSKGHAAPALYAVLSELGFFDPAEMDTLRRIESMLQGHPDMRKTPGVDMSTGSLGMGISSAVGMALGSRLSGSDFRVFVLVGDGELQEGQNWEGLQSASTFGLSNLLVLVDENGVQLDGTTEEIMPMRDIAAKMREFGLTVTRCDGHDCKSVHEALTRATSPSSSPGAPRAIVARTVKGKGVSFMEGDHSWHGKKISDEDYRIAKTELEGIAS